MEYTDTFSTHAGQARVRSLDEGGYAWEVTLLDRPAPGGQGKRVDVVVGKVRRELVQGVNRYQPVPFEPGRTVACTADFSRAVELVTACWLFGGNVTRPTEYLRDREQVAV